ncbi:hypothetical protein C1645_831124 [Glomus cerebriforme]|uniref:Uncharacterized protein n=1 Tax=Glomus cerebriforme TaxID=658196 RepID=A0A397SQT0_9GLOM|nr:hypothetical protein C1645_831124 [Glomus cerebriforme]
MNVSRTPSSKTRNISVFAYWEPKTLFGLYMMSLNAFNVEWVQNEDYGGVQKETMYGIWSKAELDECQLLIYPKFSKDNLHESYQLCGSIPRLYIDTLSEGDDYSHNLVYIYTNEEPMNIIINGHTFVRSSYTSCELKFASSIVGDKVFARLKEFYKEETYKFVFASASVSSLGSIRGYMFEIIAHNELSAGKTFLHAH